MSIPSLPTILNQGFEPVWKGEFRHYKHDICLTLHETGEISIRGRGLGISTNSMSDEFFNDYMKIALSQFKAFDTTDGL